jgi:hypothetical protein
MPRSPGLTIQSTDLVVNGRVTAGWPPRHVQTSDPRQLPMGYHLSVTRDW